MAAATADRMQVLILWVRLFAHLGRVVSTPGTSFAVTASGGLGPLGFGVHYCNHRCSSFLRSFDQRLSGVPGPVAIQKWQLVHSLGVVGRTRNGIHFVPAIKHRSGVGPAYFADTRATILTINLACIDLRGRLTSGSISRTFPLLGVGQRYAHYTPKSAVGPLAVEGLCTSAADHLSKPAGNPLVGRCYG